MNPKNYTLESGSGKIGAALAKLCAVGQLGESLLRNGVSQDAFNLFTVRLAAQHLAAGKTPGQLADIFALVSACNASAAKQALGACSVEFEGSKKQSVSDYWNKSGGAVAKPNLALLDL